MTIVQREKILLSGPDVGDNERKALLTAFDSGWIAPVGPDLNAFESELADYLRAEACVALSSRTAALHLALLNAGVGPGDTVVVQTSRPTLRVLPHGVLNGRQVQGDFPNVATCYHQPDTHRVATTP